MDKGEEGCPGPTRGDKWAVRLVQNVVVPCHLAVAEVRHSRAWDTSTILDVKSDERWLSPFLRKCLTSWLETSYSAVSLYSDARFKEFHTYQAECANYCVCVGGAIPPIKL